jgi:tRNA dimethylallyltransferase
LREIDPDAAARIHPNDPQRILRALEVHELTGIPLSAQQRRHEQSGLTTPCVRIALVPRDRGELHARVAARFRRMIARGLINEVRALREQYGFDATLPGLKLVGYREIDACIAGACDAAEAERRAITATRQLVRRQLTWLRGEDSVEWFYSDNMTLTEELLDVLRQRGVFS